MKKIENNLLESQEWTEREIQKDETKFREKEDVITSPKTEGEITGK